MLLLCLVVLLAYTPLGFQGMTALLEYLFSRSLNAPAKIEGLVLRWPLRLDIAEIRVRDPDKEYFNVYNLSIAVSARYLARGKIRVCHLRAEQIVYKEFPDATKKDVSENVEQRELQLPYQAVSFLKRFVLDELCVSSLHLTMPGLRDPLILCLGGSFSRGADNDFELRLGASAIAAPGDAPPLPAPGLNAIFGLIVPDDGPWRITAGLDVEGWKQVVENWPDDIPDKLSAEAFLSLDHGFSFILDSFHARLPLMEISGSGMLDMGTGLIVARKRMIINDLSPVLALSGGNLKGMVEAFLTVEGTFDEPLISFNMKGDVPPACLTMNVGFKKGRLDGGFLLEGIGRPVRLSADIPLRLSLFPTELQFPPDGEMEGSLTAEIDFKDIEKLFSVDDHHMTGTFCADLRLGGTIANPDLSGNLRVVDGAYENVKTGTILRNMEMSLSGHKERLSIDIFRANDGGNGTLNLIGHALIKPEDDFPFDIRLALDRFYLARNDSVCVRGGGSLTWGGDRKSSRASGSIALSMMELRIPERAPSALIDLDVVEINGNSTDSVLLPAEKTEKNPDHEMILDLDIVFPDRVFVRGRGLDSEWGGHLLVQGAVNAPKITGSLSIIRGRFIFLGKRLGIKTGTITLGGVFPPSPLLHVVTETRSGGATIIMRLTGDIEAPEISLDSIPAMPEDEILAHLLFGRDFARITPWQALIMAQALNSLRGGGSAFDLMGETRRVLHVDQIDVRESDEQKGETSVSIGKYVSERVFVELEQGINADGGRARVEVSLTPTISIETEAGTDAESSLGLFWSWSY